MAMGPISKMEEKPALTAELPSLSSYLLRFKKLCENDCTVKTEVLECRLNLSLDGFRSVLWARWLGILSSNIKTWEKDIGTSREKYERLKSNHLDDKHRSDNLHPSINNPLSQDKNSPWAQFFKDSELRKDIERVSKTLMCVDLVRFLSISYDYTPILIHKELYIIRNRLVDFEYFTK